jgi:hypothetical protein
VILDRQLAVGYAGDDPAKLKHLVGPGSTPDEVLEELAVVPNAHYVVLADGELLRLWQVREGEVEERTATIRRAWAGNRDAYGVFQPTGVESLAESMDEFLSASRYCGRPDDGVRILWRGGRWGSGSAA